MRLDFAPGYAAPTPFAAPRRQDRQRLREGDGKGRAQRLSRAGPGADGRHDVCTPAQRPAGGSGADGGFRLSFRCFYFIFIRLFETSQRRGRRVPRRERADWPEPERIPLVSTKADKALENFLCSDGGIDKNAPGNPAFEWEAACAGGRLPFRCGRRNIRKAGGWAWG